MEEQDVQPEAEPIEAPVGEHIVIEVTGFDLGLFSEDERS